MPLTREEKILAEMGFKQITQNEFDHPLYGYLWLRNNFIAKDIAPAIFESGVNYLSPLGERLVTNVINPYNETS